MSAVTSVGVDGGSLTVRIPLKLRKRGGRKIVVMPENAAERSWAPPRPRIDTALIKAIARAHRWQRLLEEGTFSTLRELAMAERISSSYISRLLRFSLYAPIVIEAALDGTLSHEAVARLGKDDPVQLWRVQTSLV